MHIVGRLGIAAFCLVISPAVAAAGQRVALVIGNSAYQHTSPLKNPKHDAADTAAVLKGLGFRVIEGLDVHKAAMDRTIRDFAAALAKAKVGLFFYAGHGLQVSGENYLVPIDAKLETASALEFEAVRVQLVQRVMEQATETNVLFLDACRDNPLSRNLARALGTRSSSIGRGLAPVESGVGTLISFSTQPGNVALDGTGRNSPFAAALVHQLASSREDLSTILIGVRNMVMADTANRQVPWEHSALRARLYLHDASPSTAAATGRQPAMSEAAQAWSATKDSTSEAVLRAFIAKYPGTVFESLAAARLEELEERSKRVASNSPVPDAAAQPTSDSKHPFDGVWNVATTGGEHCSIKAGGYQIRIVNSTVQGFGSTVGSNGAVTYDKPGPINPAVKVRHTAKLSGDKGQGTYRALRGKCAGTTTMTRFSTTPLDPGPERGQRSVAYDGAWEVAITGNRNCPFKTHAFPIRIENGAITAAHPQPGRVDEQGNFEFATRGKANPSVIFKYLGKLAHSSGEGKWSSAGSLCAGTAVLKRLAVSTAQ